MDPGMVTKQTGPVSYVRGQTWNGHAEQLRPAAATEAQTEQSD